MADNNVQLSRLVELSGKDIFIVSKSGNCIFSNERPIKLSLKEIQENINSSYKGYMVFRINTAPEEHYVCIETSDEDSSKLDTIILFSIEAILNRGSSPIEYLKDILDGRQDTHGINWINREFASGLSGHLIAIELKEKQNTFKEINEIIINTLNTVFVFEHNSNIVVFTDEQEINTACIDLNENILSELYMECTIAIGPFFKDITELQLSYNSCMEMLYLKHKYKLCTDVLSYDSMYPYRIVNSMDSELKKSIHKKVFTQKFLETFNSETETTIEAFFENNLNLTDTAARLYVHRNTLLYRIEKIYKSTGYDLRKFEDSWLLRLAWMINKEFNK